MGFCDPAPKEEKALRIRFLHRGRPHIVNLADQVLIGFRVYELFLSLTIASLQVVLNIFRSISGDPKDASLCRACTIAARMQAWLIAHLLPQLMPGSGKSCSTPTMQEKT